MTDLDRRAFFRRSLNKVSKTVVSYADKKAAQKATRWIRPPYALDELEFTLACSRCGDCMEACDYGVIFPLPASYGASAVKTPALDLIKKGCRLCADWPCVTACEAGALRLPEIAGVKSGEKNATPENIPLPRMALASISTETCLPYLGPECGACRSSCCVAGALGWDMTRPVINNELCCGCGLCRQACITDPSSITLHKLSQLEDETP